VLATVERDWSTEQPANSLRREGADVSKMICVKNLTRRQDRIAEFQQNVCFLSMNLIILNCEKDVIKIQTQLCSIELGSLQIQIQCTPLKSDICFGLLMVISFRIQHRTATTYHISELNH